MYNLIKLKELNQLTKAVILDKYFTIKQCQREETYKAVYNFCLRFSSPEVPPMNLQTEAVYWISLSSPSIRINPFKNMIKEIAYPQ